MSDFEDFKRILVWLFALYPGAQLGAAAIEAWWSLLSDYPTDLIRSSARRMVTSRDETRFPPSAAELLDYVRSDAKLLRKPVATTAPALPEATLETALGPDHPVTKAMEAATDKVTGQIDQLAAVRAIVAVLEGRMSISSTQPKPATGE